MVRIINYQKRQAEDGREFFVLEISGGLEMVRSKETNQFYATAKKASIPCTFDEFTCKALIGSEMDGEVTKQEVEPYPYVIKDTGEEIILTHRWVYSQPSENTDIVEDLSGGSNQFNNNFNMAHMNGNSGNSSRA